MIIHSRNDYSVVWPSMLDGRIYITWKSKITGHKCDHFFSIEEALDENLQVDSFLLTDVVEEGRALLKEFLIKNPEVLV